MNNNDNQKNIVKCVIDGKTVINTANEIANGFNKYFINKYITEVGKSLS